LKIKPWTIALAVLIIIDSIYTVIIRFEANPFILWTMDKFTLTLNQAMVARVIYCLPLLYILNKTNWSKFTFFAYIGLYIVLSGAMLYET
jgi:hypothetical protein